MGHNLVRESEIFERALSLRLPKPAFSGRCMTFQGRSLRNDKQCWFVIPYESAQNDGNFGRYSHSDPALNRPMIRPAQKRCRREAGDAVPLGDVEAGAGMNLVGRGRIVVFGESLDHLAAGGLALALRGARPVDERKPCPQTLQRTSLTVLEILQRTCMVAFLPFRGLGGTPEEYPSGSNSQIPPRWRSPERKCHPVSRERPDCAFSM
jgi:hypothetical protein